MGDSIRNDEQFLDDLAPLVDGDEGAVSRHADKLGTSDEHRDLRHEASKVANLLGDSGMDYDPPADMEERVLGALDARAPKVEDAATSGARERQEQPTAEAKQEPEKKEQPAASAKTTKKKSNVIPLFGFAAAAAALLLAFTVGIVAWLSGGDDGGEAVVAADGAFHGTLVRTVRAADDQATGVVARAEGEDDFAPVTVGTEMQPGSTIRTDERTRAQLELSDGTVLVLNHDTELTLDEETPRELHLARGELVADVAHLEQGPRAIFATPTGKVEVLGTKFVLSATEENASVRVTRGAVRIHAAAGGESEVKAGQEGLMPKSGEVTVSPAMHLASDVAWSELGAVQQGTDEPIPGLGELRARKPGEREDRERPLHLAHHRVTTRIVGNVARTEIEETFQNDSGDTLEGIYRFPLPPDARIASLELEVDGEWEHGAFVEKDRAQQIWRGVIRNATPEQQRVQNEEFIWVPGPWRDPALLEWQRGGRFELRIFPIPANGARSIRLAYTQTIAPHGGDGRRYTYPLAHSSDESTRVGRFEVDVRVAGTDQVTPHGYDMAGEREDNAQRLRFAADNFLPKGDLMVDYALPGGESELRYWTFKGEATVPPADNSREGNPDVVRLQREVHEDDRGYAVFALRPELPAWTEGQLRDYVLVVDSSQSMVGERYDRAVELAGHVVSEMDRRDRVMVLACDATCRTMATSPATPSSRAAQQVKGWLRTVSPAGASNVGLAMREAVAAIEGKRQPERDVRVIYIGDGAASIGHRRAGSLAGEVQALTDDPQISFTTVGIGGDADTMTMEAVARAGGGHYVPYVPGQRASLAALAVLETTYGVSLESASVEFPEGIADVAPAELPTIRAGEEVIVVGRLEGGGEVRGDVVLRGKVGGRDFEERYPVSLQASTAQGNAFVPRLWASETIEKLELGGQGEDTDRIVALSKAFGVMSPHTSLLVLESEAMFRAFGVDRNQPALQWSGDEDMEYGTSTGLNEHQDAITAQLGLMGAGRGGGGAGEGTLGLDSLADVVGGTGSGSSSRTAGRERGARRRRSAGPPARPQARPRSEATTADVGDGFFNDRRDNDRAAAADPAPDEPMAEAEEQPSMPMRTTRRPGSGQWMRRVWFRDATVRTSGDLPPAWQQNVAQAEAALRENPDSRDRHKLLVRAASRAGQLDRAREVAEQWIERDRLDPEALTYLSDVLGRQGKREEAVRLLSGIVDLAPDNVILQERMANAFERAGMPARACAHRIALAEIQKDDAEAVARAVRCERSLGREQGATRLLEAVDGESERERVEEEARDIDAPSRLRGDLILDASWSGGSDVDLSLITPEGTRLSWMGGRVNVVGEDATRVGREKLGLRRTAVGSYAVEVSRGAPGDTRAVSGTIDVRVTMNGTLTTRRIPFTLAQGETRATVGRIDVRRQSRLVPQ